MDRWDLTDHLLDVALAEEPSDLAQRLLSALLAFTDGRRAALFEAPRDGLRLFGSRGLDQAALDEIEELWRSCRDELQAGRPVFTAAAVAFPVMANPRLVGLLFAERTHAARFADPRDLQALAQFARVAARALAGRRDAASDLAHTPPADVARDQLFTILEQNEWNIARVARLLGVTRPTIYARLQRLGLPRRHRRLGKRQTT